jgi:hypothetical protein
MSTLRNVYTIRLLRLALGCFFIVLGILGILTNIDEGAFSLTNQNITLEVIFGIVEVVCGLLLLLGFITFSNTKAISMGGVIVFIFWLVRIVLTKIVWCLYFGGNTVAFRFIPSFSTWILMLTVELVVAAALLVVIKRYDY